MKRSIPHPISVAPFVAALLSAATAVVPIAAQATDRSARPGESHRRAAWMIDLSAGPHIGLDRPLRGGAFALGVGVSEGGLSASIRAGTSYDASLGAFIADAGLAIGLGDGLRLLVGGELPLGSPKLASGGSRWPLVVASWPCRFALAVPLARLATGSSRRPSWDLEAELSYSAYRVESAGSGAGAEIASGLAGFSAGFRALLALRLSWSGRSPPGGP